MSDFHQSGLITTLHRLSPGNLAQLESELKQFTRERPVSLVLPCLYTEIRGPGLRGILDVLREVPYLRHIVVSVSGTEKLEEFLAVRRFLHDVPDVVCVWGSGPTVGELFHQLRGAGLDPGPDGKGRAVWLAAGYALSRGDSHALAFHDCDVLTYDREFLARLCYPVVHPNLDYEYSKGYYGRATDRLHGRVTRAFVTPLLQSLRNTLGPLPLLDFLDEFRYPLAGEFAMTAALARQVRIPSDWGLEIGLLAEVFRNAAIHRVCQVEIADNYDHKHQELSADNAQLGLHRMVIDIATSLFRNLASVGVQFDSGFLNTLGAAYLRKAQDIVGKYADEARINGLRFDQHDEEVMVETFAAGLRTAGLSFVRDPMRAPLIPNWHRVSAALPDFLTDLSYAVQIDCRS
ncbi:MAG: glycosyl transferase [Deltaproteobacteria bacterium]|nr:glycosyl transferase [Deltaproteobacteria bacterium]MBW2414559.1 glycosyl transferase [Deltaproteobacteria bacterium]